MSTFSPNLDLELVARGGDVGTWDTPTNSNWTIVDSVVGGIATIPISNSGVILSGAQFQSRNLTFTGTITTNIVITFPTSFTKSYEVQNLCSGTSAAIVVLETTAAGGQAIACPPGETVDVFNDGTNLKFKNLGRIGSYVDYAGSAVPNWVSGCTVPPYLPCTAASFSSATYPILATILGGTLTPDRRGTVAANLDQGVGRLTNFSGFLTVGGAQNVTVAAGNLPALGVAISDPLHFHQYPSISVQIGNGGAIQYSGPVIVPLGSGGGANNTSTVGTGISATANSGGANTALANVQPTTIIGITMIRAG